MRGGGGGGSNFSGASGGLPGYLSGMAMSVVPTGEEKARGSYYECFHCHAKLGFVQNMKLLARFGAECLDCHAKGKKWDDVWIKVDQATYFGDDNITSPDLQHLLLAALPLPVKMVRSDPQMYQPTADFREYPNHSPLGNPTPATKSDEVPVRASTTATRGPAHSAHGGSPCLGPQIARSDGAGIQLNRGAGFSPGSSSRLEAPAAGQPRLANGAAPSSIAQGISPGFASRLEAAPMTGLPRTGSASATASPGTSGRLEAPARTSGYETPPRTSGYETPPRASAGYVQGGSRRGSTDMQWSAAQKPAGPDASIASTGYSTPSSVALGANHGTSAPASGSYGRLPGANAGAAGPGYPSSASGAGYPPTSSGGSVGYPPSSAGYPPANGAPFTSAPQPPQYGSAYLGSSGQQGQALGGSRRGSLSGTQQCSTSSCAAQNIGVGGGSAPVSRGSSGGHSKSRGGRK